MSNQEATPDSQNTSNPENQQEEPIKPRISLIKQWNILMQSIEAKTGLNGYVVIGLLLICVILVYLNIFESFITNFIGTVYPGFCTIKSIEKKSKDKKNWLTYWLIFGSFLIVDKFAVIIMKIIPFYFVLKILFLIWMFLPGSNGSAIVYNLLLKKIFKYLETNVDPYMKEAKTFASTVKVDVTKKISGSLLKLKSLKKGPKAKGGDMAEALKASQELQKEENQVFQSAIIFGSNPISNNDDNSKSESLKKDEEKIKEEEEKRKKEEEEKRKQEEEEKKKQEEELKRKQEEEEKRKQEEEEKKKQEEELKRKQEEEEKRKQEEEDKRKQEEEEKRKKEEEEAKQKQIQEEEKRKQEEEEQKRKKEEEEEKQKQIQEEEENNKDNEEIARLEEMQKNLSEVTKIVENNLNSLENTDNKESEQKKEEETNIDAPKEQKEEDKKENEAEEKIKSEWDDVLGGDIIENDENKEENKEETKQEEKKEGNEEAKNNGE